MGRSDDIADLRLALARLNAVVSHLSGRPTTLVANAGQNIFEEIYRLRRLRDEVFGDTDLFAEPGWDMLLGLARAEEDGRQSSITDVCLDSCVPPTTALRWLKQLEAMGLVETQQDSMDARRRFVRLTDKAREKLHAYAMAVSQKG